MIIVNGITYVITKIYEDTSALQSGGKKRPFSLLFSDLTGFTTLSEDMDAQNLLERSQGGPQSPGLCHAHGPA
jgi:hypothetical protein